MKAGETAGADRGSTKHCMFGELELYDLVAMQMGLE